MPWTHITTPALNMWVNLAQVAYAQIAFADDQAWHVQISTNGRDWVIHPRQFADAASAQTFLDTFAAAQP